MDNQKLTDLVAAFQANETDRTFRRIYAGFEGLLVTLANAREGQRDDLIQEGALGLLDAVRTFDPARGVPFVAYARKKARWSISKACRPISRHRDHTVNSEPDSHASAPADAFEQTHAREIVAKLSDVSRYVLDGIARGETGDSIASENGISAGRVSQIKNEIRANIRGEK